MGAAPYKGTVLVHDSNRNERGPGLTSAGRPAPPYRQAATTPSALPSTRKLGSKAHAPTAATSLRPADRAVTTRTGSPVTPSHTRTLPSEPPVKTRVPWSVTHTHLTGPVWPSRVCRHRPVTMSHTRTLASPPPDARMWPSKPGSLATDTHRTWAAASGLGGGVEVGVGDLVAINGRVWEGRGGLALCVQSRTMWPHNAGALKGKWCVKGRVHVYGCTLGISHGMVMTRLTYPCRVTNQLVHQATR